MEERIADNKSAKAYSVKCERKGQVLIVTPLSDLDHHLAMKIREAADEEIDQGKVHHLLFDFSKIRFMDSSGIGVVMGRYKKIMFQGGKLACCGVSREVDRIMTLSGLYSIMKGYPDRKTAIQSLEGEK